jgi:hypothetical protein
MSLVADTGAVTFFHSWDFVESITTVSGAAKGVETHG